MFGYGNNRHTSEERREVYYGVGEYNNLVLQLRINHAHIDHISLSYYCLWHSHKENGMNSDQLIISNIAACLGLYRSGMSHVH